MSGLRVSKVGSVENVEIEEGNPGLVSSVCTEIAEKGDVEAGCGLLSSRDEVDARKVRFIKCHFYTSKVCLAYLQTQTGSFLKEHEEPPCKIPVFDAASKVKQLQVEICQRVVWLR